MAEGRRDVERRLRGGEWDVTTTRREGTYAGREGNEGDERTTAMTVNEDDDEGKEGREGNNAVDNNMVVVLNLPQTPLLTIYTAAIAVTRHSEALLTYSRTVTTTNHALEVAKNVGMIVGKGAQIYSLGWVAGAV